MLIADEHSRAKSPEHWAAVQLRLCGCTDLADALDRGDMIVEVMATLHPCTTPVAWAILQAALGEQCRYALCLTAAECCASGSA